MITGTEQRVYGTLAGCRINVSRFAFIYGTKTRIPNTYYNYTYGPAIYPPPGQSFSNRFPTLGNSISFETVLDGHTSISPITRLESVSSINGNISSYIKTSYDIFYITGASIVPSNNEYNEYLDSISICVINFRISGHKITINIHGSSAPHANISMWFNKATCWEEHQLWEQLGYADHDTIMSLDTFEFPLINYDKSSIYHDVTWCRGSIFIIEVEGTSITSVSDNTLIPEIITTKLKR